MKKAEQFSHTKLLLAVVVFVVALAAAVLSIVSYGVMASAEQATAASQMQNTGWDRDKTIALIIVGGVFLLIVLAGVLGIVLQRKKLERSTDAPQPADAPAAKETDEGLSATDASDAPAPIVSDTDAAEIHMEPETAAPKQAVAEQSHAEPVHTEKAPPAKATAAKSTAAKSTAAKTTAAKATAAKETKAPPAETPAPKAAAKKPAAKKPVKSGETRTRMGKYVVGKTPEGKYRFMLKAPNGQLLYESRDYASKQTCTAGVGAFRRAVESGGFLIDDDKSGRFQFRLQANTTFYEGETLATRESVENVIESIKHNAQSTTVENAID